MGRVERMGPEGMNESTSAWDLEDLGLLGRVATDADRGAFRRLFDRYQTRVFLFVRRRLRDEELAREVTGDVFLEVWSQAAGFRGESRVSSWIFGIARFKCLEAGRHRGRLKRFRVVAAGDEVISRVPDRVGPATQRLDARDSLRQIERLMHKLPADQREALELTVLEGLALDEVAARQNVSPDTVKTRVSRARRSLRRLLGSAEGVTA